MVDVVVLASMNERRRMRKALIVVWFASFLISGTCGTFLYISPPAPYGQTLIWEVSGFSSSLDPHVATFKNDEWIISNVYETLVSFSLIVNGADEFVGQLAKWWSISSNRLEYTFHLEEGVCFYDGTPFNASCVKYNFERLLAIFETNGPAWMIAEHILGGRAIENAVYDFGMGTPQHIGNFSEWRDNSNAIEVEDEFTIIIRLEKPYTPFIAVLATTAASIISPTFIERNGGIAVGFTNSILQFQSCGTGPYQIHNVITDDYIELTEFADYWKEAEMRVYFPYAGAIDQVIIKTVESGNERISNLNESLCDACEWPKSEADLVYNGATTSPSGDGTIKSRLSSLKVWADEPTYEMEGMIFNCREFYSSQPNPLQNPFFLRDFRNAVRLSFNASAYIEQALYGFGIQPRGAIPRGMQGYNEYGSPFGFDIISAVESWNNAMNNGLNNILANNSYELTFLYNSGLQEHEKACEIIRDGIGPILAHPSALQPNSSLTLHIEAIEWGPFIPYESRLIGFLDLNPEFSDPSDYATCLYRSDGIIDTFGNISSITDWNLSYIDEMLSEADQSINPVERADLYIQIQNYAAERNPCMWLAQETNFQVVAFDVHGYQFNPAFKPHFYVYWKTPPSAPFMYYSVIPYPYCIIAGLSGAVSFVGIIVLTYMIEREKKAQFIAQREQAG